MVLVQMRCRMCVTVKNDSFSTNSHVYVQYACLFSPHGEIRWSVTTKLVSENSGDFITNDMANAIDMRPFALDDPVGHGGTSRPSEIIAQ
jgi:hypothetical protein